MIVAGSLGMLALRLWVLEPMTVVSDSMEPTVMQGSMVLIRTLSMSHDTPSAGQMVVFHSPENDQPTVKRVAGVAGQTVAIRDGGLFVDGSLVPEDYLDPRQTDGTFFHQVTVPHDQLFLLGDNRVSSIDSRDYGFVPVPDVTGTVLWPR